jgi:hypothetical protein
MRAMLKMRLASALHMDFCSALLDACNTQRVLQSASIHFLVTAETLRYTSVPSLEPVPELVVVRNWVPRCIHIWKGMRT